MGKSERQIGRDLSKSVEKTNKKIQIDNAISKFHKSRPASFPTSVTSNNDLGCSASPQMSI